MREEGPLCHRPWQERQGSRSKPRRNAQISMAKQNAGHFLFQSTPLAFLPRFLVQQQSTQPDTLVWSPRPLSLSPSYSRPTELPLSYSVTPNCPKRGLYHLSRDNFNNHVYLSCFALIKFSFHSMTARVISATCKSSHVPSWGKTLHLVLPAFLPTRRTTMSEEWRYMKIPSALLGRCKLAIFVYGFLFLI